jgi:hypothetical protein
MDKKQFFESLVSTKQETSEPELQACGVIKELLYSLKAHLGDTKLTSEFEILEQEILFRIWMFEKICNVPSIDQTDKSDIWGPVIVIFLQGDVVFVNKTYCLLSGLSSTDVQNHARNNTLYRTIYE